VNRPGGSVTPVADEADLLRRARAGSFEAFEELVSLHERKAFSIALNILRNRADAEDAVQTAFINAMQHLGDFREEASFGTWMARIAANAALKALRRKRTVSLDADAGETRRPDFVADWRAEPSRLLEQEETRKTLDAAIDSLPEGQRLVFVLRDVTGLSVAETAKELGISEGNVKVRLLRARLALREKLTREFGDEGRRVDMPGKETP
jgi:RNA polymerase sigma-70 factor (ECF subfamily)